ncbi:MAG: amidohydrolase family protein [Clostridia bacterium]|nr:amidohydrolase family protein [Clostridia bacterium]
MKIYDMHVHVNGGEPEPAGLLSKMEDAGVYGGAVFSAEPEPSSAPLQKLPYRERLKNVLDWCRGVDGRLFPILWVHPFEADVGDQIKDAALSGIRGFKVICDTFSVGCPESMRMLETIEETKLPVIFHSGILWSGTDTSRFNRPAEWEALLRLSRGVKFSMGHCSWPWHDECIAVYGKFLNSYLERQSSEMFFDVTPGTPVIYRRDLLTKLFTVGYDVENNIMFGTDSMANDYDRDWVAGWIARDNAIYDELGVPAATREKIYKDNFFRFLSGEDVSHVLPEVNKNSQG